MVRTLTTRAALALLLALSGCHADPAPEDQDDAGSVPGDQDAAIDASAPPADGPVEQDCCGTRVTSSGGAIGVCDPWCLFAIPCDSSCDRVTSICVSRAAGADGGTPTSECVPRSSTCEDLSNCGGPAPDPSCAESAACLEELDCTPRQVTHSGYLVLCLGA